MFTRPAGVFQIIYPATGGIEEIPIQPDRWKLFCDKGAADAMAKEMNAIPGVSVTVALDPECPMGYDVQNPGNGVNMWNIAGTYAPNGTADGAPTYPISENAGWLDDRRTKPSTAVDVDRNPGADKTFPVGGTVLHIDILSGVAQFRWGR